MRSEFVHHLSLAVVITMYGAALPCSAPVTLPVRVLFFSADLLISQAFLEIFAFWPPFTGIYRDGGEVGEHREPGSGDPSIDL